MDNQKEKSFSLSSKIDQLSNQIENRYYVKYLKFLTYID